MLLGGEGESEMGRLQGRWVPGPGLREDRGGMATAGDSAEVPPSLGQSSYSDPLACPPPGLGDDSGLPPDQHVAARLCSGQWEGGGFEGLSSTSCL